MIETGWLKGMRLTCPSYITFDPNLAIPRIWLAGSQETMGGSRRTRYRGEELTGLAGYFVATAYGLARMANLLSSQNYTGRSVDVICLEVRTKTPMESSD